MKHLIALIFLFEISLAAFGTCWATDTLVVGNVYGTWRSDLTYRVIDNCTVPSGETLTIEPGTMVIVGIGYVIDVRGQIVAVGTSDQPIRFEAPNADVHWNGLIVEPSSITILNQLKYCNFTNATVAVSLRLGFAYYSTDTLRTEILNCRFVNCSQAAITGESHGRLSGCMPTCQGYHIPHLNPVIKNCLIERTSIGCLFIMSGSNYQGQVARGYASPTITNTIFSNVDSAAVQVIASSYGGASSPVFENNAIVGCGRGVVTMDLFDIRIKNNIFFRTRIGVTRSGSQSSLVAYNCFSLNDSAKFIGYPASYGQPVQTNHNGDSCDIALNFFVNPTFEDTVCYRLSPSSNCADAGDPTSVYSDMCFPPSLSTLLNDVGAYGGPDACAWDNCIVTLVDHTLHSTAPTRSALLQNYPNPFNPETKITFAIPRAGDVTLRVYDLLGREVATLVNERMQPGSYEKTFNGTGFASGVYLYRLKAGDFVETKKLVLVR